MASVAATLKKKGVAMTLERVSGLFDPITGLSTPTSTVFTIYGIELDNKSSILRKGSGDVSSKSSALVEPTVSISVGDRLTISGVVWSVSSVSEVRPQGRVVMIDVGLSR